MGADPAQTHRDCVVQPQYAPDYDCRETGAFSQEGYSLTGLLLVKVGVLPPANHWWDRPYRTEDGVVWPAGERAASD
jgi:hypothetical protein